MRLKDKVAIVTGASRGIGQAIAERFAAEGAHLVLGYLKQDQAIATVEATCRQQGVWVHALKADITQPGTAQALCEAALQQFGKLDILINNAAMAAPEVLANLSDEALDLMIATNITGLVKLTRAVLRPMIQQHSGCIINLSSLLATRAGRGNTVYAGTKGFVESFTRALATEVGRKQIRVLAVAPGVIETSMSTEMRSWTDDTVLHFISMGRYGKPEEVAALISYLASDEASYLSGATYAINGAWI